MAVLLTNNSNSYVQFITVLIIFVLVLGVTAWTTKWIANYQKQQGSHYNIEVMETARISNNKVIQIVRAGETYMVIAVCKDTVTMLGVVPEEQLKKNQNDKDFNFRELLDKTLKKDSSKPNESKENDT